MKKTLLFLTASVFVSLGANSQIANSGFENWTSQGTYDEPDGWATLNFLAGFGIPAAVNKDAVANSGNFSAKLETIEASFFGTTDTLTGLMMLGNLDTLGSPYSQRPTAMEFYYKYSSPGADFGVATVTLTMWDDQNSTQVDIGNGTMQIDAAGTFTLANVPITYTAPDMPDSIQITFISSGADIPIPGTVLNVDDISFVLPVNAVQNAVMQHPVVYPNPASDYLYVKTAGLEITGMEITDLSGRRVEKITLTGTGAKISVAHLHGGNYFYELKNGQESVSRGQFHVNH
ncbi:MAG: T9SS type A sorting domain-containing protein [Bacteroidota bacterium]